MTETDYHWYAFTDLTGEELYAMLKLRQEVFVVEQRCAYQDCDDLDQMAWHLVGWRQAAGSIVPVAYLRVIPPGSAEEMPAIGRLLLRADRRGRGEGKKLLGLALKRIEEVYPETAVRITAQSYLIEFYRQFGFQPASEVFDEDGIPHLRMIRPPQRRR